MTDFTSGTEHLQAELRRLDLLLQRQALRLRAAGALTADEFRGLYIPDEQADALLQSQAAGREEPPEIGALTERIARAREENAARAGRALPLPRLAERFALDSFEADVLLLCAAPEVELRYETLYAYIQNDVTKKRPTVDLAFRLFCETTEERFARRAAFDTTAPLLRHHLIRLYDDPQDRDPPLPARYIKADERIMDCLLDREEIDHRLRPFTRLMVFAPTTQRPNDPITQSPNHPTPSLAALPLPDGVRRQLARAAPLFAGRGVFLFHGPEGAGRQSAAAALCAEHRRPLLAADLAEMGASEQPFGLLMSLLRREAEMRDAALYLRRFEALLAEEEPARSRLHALQRVLAGLAAPLFLGSDAPWHPDGRWGGCRFLSFEFPLPAYPLRLQLWTQALANGTGRRVSKNADLPALANKFVLSPGQIAEAAREAAHRAAARCPERHEIGMEDLYAAARARSSRELRGLAQKIEPVYSWEDIVLPPRPMQQLREVAASVRYRHVVYSDWGFDRKLALGKGLNVLFSGLSGTGKTMAAQVLARELALDLYRIDLSAVVSKYIGETEKNLSAIFRAARASNAILFFDEADALFGKRSEVKDAHDRYANIEVAYLLQQVEEYEGMVILATNLSRNMDEAFARRMHHTLEFPFPDAPHRERIWKGMFPPEAPLAPDTDMGFLARQFEMAGGNIRNAALAGAFLAAREGGAIRMEHLIQAVARELQKLGKLPSRADFREYYEVIRERE
jgi:hypothetical protein